jgi:hypothetical protein
MKVHFNTDVTFNDLTPVNSLTIAFVSLSGRPIILFYIKDFVLLGFP